MTSKGGVSDPGKLFLEQLDTIEGAIRFACRRAMMRDDEADDFASAVKLKLIDHDYAIIRKHDPASSFKAYIGVVVQRLLLDYRIACWGKWHASAEAKRLGDAAVMIEAMLYRDGRAIDEIIPLLLQRWPYLTRARIDAIARSLPQRTRRPRTVEIELAAETVGADQLSVQDAAFEADRAELSDRIARVIRETTAGLEERDRLVFRLHFEGGMSVAEISRTLHVEQKPLYRKLQRALAKMRARLEAAGIAAEDVNELLAGPGTDLDFGFSGGSALPRPSSDQEES
ncbi:MAG TPA: sigma-70 family RNA polymerase sigma factor [Thermoanaerobaculia bacterium]|nr:sigma-70 family RNA polymerase sigma factor [Thermoanaerobaculia bacterium]